MTKLFYYQLKPNAVLNGYEEFKHFFDKIGLQMAETYILKHVKP